MGNGRTKRVRDTPNHRSETEPFATPQPRPMRGEAHQSFTPAVRGGKYSDGLQSELGLRLQVAVPSDEGGLISINQAAKTSQMKMAPHDSIIQRFCHLVTPRRSSSEVLERVPPPLEPDRAHSGLRYHRPHTRQLIIETVKGDQSTTLFQRRIATR